MTKPCPKSKDGRHNFPIPNGLCAWGCGITQAELSGRMKAPPDLFGRALQRAINPKPPKRGIHTELHDLVAQLIEQFKEPPEIEVRGKKVKTFGYYLGRLKRVPMQKIYQWRAELRESRDIRNEGKVFWWKYREYLKSKPKGGNKT